MSGGRGDLATSYLSKKLDNDVNGVSKELAKLFSEHFKVVPMVSDDMWNIHYGEKVGGCKPDGQLWYDIKTMQLVPVFEAKKEDEGGNAEERWNDNANTASVMNPECKYHTFAIGKGVRKKWIRRQKKSYVEYNKRGLLDSRWTLEEKGISYEDIKEIMTNTLNEILKKSHKPPVYPKEPQTLNEFM